MVEHLGYIYDMKQMLKIILKMCVHSLYKNFIKFFL